MDPNANLQEQEAILTMHPDTHPDTLRYAKRTRLPELRKALTDWIRAGGFAPEWAKYPRASKHFGM